MGFYRHTLFLCDYVTYKSGTNNGVIEDIEVSVFSSLLIYVYETEDVLESATLKQL